QCLAGSRILVQSSIAEPFIAEFVARARNLKIGTPDDASTELGPLATQGQMERVLSYVDVARQEGCEVLAGGNRRSDMGSGYYIDPIVVQAFDNTIRTCQEEIFGPFATFLVFDTFEQAVAMANDSKF